MNEKKNKEHKNRKIQEMQVLEQSLQNIILQKQVFQMELSETQAAEKEIGDSKEIFKIVGQLMIKTDKEKIKEELLNKEKLLKLRIDNLSKQEETLSEKLESLKKEIS